MFSWLLCNLNITLDVSLITPHIKPGWTLGPGASYMRSYCIASSMFHQLNPCRFWLQLISSDPSRARSSNIFPDLSNSPKNSCWNISKKLRQTAICRSRAAAVARMWWQAMTGQSRGAVDPPLSQCRALCKCPGKHKGLKSFGVTTLAIQGVHYLHVIL